MTTVTKPRLARLLPPSARASSPRLQATAEVRAAVEAEWRRTVAARQQRRRFTGLGHGGRRCGCCSRRRGWRARCYLPEAATVATLARVVGDVRAELRRWPMATAGAVARASKSGDELRTGSDGRAALELASGVAAAARHAARSSRSTTVTRQRSRRAPSTWIRRAGPARRLRSSCSTRRPADVRHLGTQYEARLGRQRAAGRRARGPGRSRAAAWRRDRPTPASC